MHARPLPPLAALVAALLIAACATPLKPTGGPADTTPPTLVSSLPATGAVRVTDRRVVLTFSERLGTQGAARAVTVTPEPPTPAQVSVRGRDLVIDLPEPLADSTTYVVTVSADLKDARGVALAQPQTVAFATGDRVDAGRLAGTVRDPATGRGVAGLSVWAYRLPAAFGLSDSAAVAAGIPPDSLAALAAQRLPDPREAWPLVYRTQTGADGAFALAYLREGPYYVVAVDDRNRNRLADPGERFAVPRTPIARADSADATRIDAFVTALDTIPPTLRSVRALSDRRFLLRYSEGVRILNDPNADVLDTLLQSPSPGTLYPNPDQPSELILWTREPVPPGPAIVRTTSVADSTNSPRWAESPVFDVPARADTARTRFVRFEPAPPAPDSAAVLGPRAGQTPASPPLVVLSGPSDTPTTILARRTPPGRPGEILFDTLRVTGTRVPVRACAPGPDGVACFVEMVPDVVRVVAPDSVYEARYRALAPNQLGGLIGRVVGAAGPVVVEAFPPEGEPLRTPPGPDGAFAFQRLAPGDYRIRVVLDRDGDGRWSGGSLAPYASPERIVFVTQPQTVRARFETDVGEIRLDAADAGG